ncbi:MULTISPECIES: hypothetical protein [Methylobacterium]|uniref:hypothetical protein n=1 Tax=Methylobacterium TaxID=407 RepID=UPI0013ED5BD9|nr:MULTISPECIES: hypothetical protein [unclassified Methylobacterium]NGM38031.1 hypothetical protein [Methylobacterium sp. DB0501]
MNDATPKEIATHFGIATALSFSAIAAPFVPETILAYAGYRYLRHFTYGWRTWRAPARVPLHLGRRGYRDETTRRRGDASWPIGLAATGQVWLRREDLVQGLSINGDDPRWQEQAICSLALGACINRMGAIVVQSVKQPMLTGRLAEVARPYGRDNEIYSIDLQAVPRPPLRIAPSTLASAVTDLGLGPDAGAVNQALMPILEMLGARHQMNPLSLYEAFIDEAALGRLVNGEYEIGGDEVSAARLSSSDGAALRAAIKPLKELKDETRANGRKALAVHAREIAGLTSVSLSEGFELRSALSTGGLVCIRPSSALTTALVIARCVEALAEGKSGHAATALIHVVYPEALSGASARRFRAAAMQAGAISSLSLPARSANHVYKATRNIGAVSIQEKPSAPAPDGTPLGGKITSAIKECLFTLDIQLPKAPTPQAVNALTDADVRRKYA